MPAARGSRVSVDGNDVSYRDVLADTDLVYEVTAGAVKETIRVRKPGRSTWQFELDTAGLTPRITADGSITLSDAGGTVRVEMPPVVAWDSSGNASRPSAATGGSYQLERAGGDVWRLTVAVDEAWLRDPARVYPVSVDPTFSFPDDVSYAYKSDGYSCQSCGLAIGNPLSAGTMWRSAFHFDYSSLWGKTVVGARMDVSNNRTPTGVDRTYPAQLHHATAMNFDGVGQLLGESLVGQVGSFSDARFTNYLRTAVANRDLRPYFMLVGSEQPNVWTYKNLSTTLYVDTGSAPPAATRVAPADNSVLTNLTPTLQVSPVTDPDGDAVKYCFKVATGADAKSGVVVDSGCLTSPTWTVPAGVLQDGVAYTWHASTSSGISRTTPSWIGRFRVDQRIGQRGPSPTDGVGPVEVNLANGNVTTAQATPTFTTVGGTAGLTFTYNSQQRAPVGLRASYFSDLSQTGNIADGQQPLLVRTEPQVNVDWATGSPHAPALAADWFVVRWEGFLQAPATGTYQFAGVHDDGLKVWLNNSQVYGVATPSDVNWSQSTGVSLTAGQRVPIKVEFAEKTSTALARLFVRTSDATTVPPQMLPATWLSTTDSPVLPQGWTLSADLDGSGAAYTTAQITDQTVVLTDATGAKHTYTKKSAGGYSAPEGEDGILALDTAGRVTLLEGEDVYVFRADGKLDSQSSVADSRKPAALRNAYDGTPSRLRKITDPVSVREHVLHYNRSGDNCYGSTPAPQGFDALPPAQMLCRIAYWDGTETRLWYVGGQLARIEDPGAEITDYTYYPQGPLSGVRGSVAADWVAVDPAGRGGTTATMTVIGYDNTAAAKPKVTAVTEPEPTPGQARPQHSYRYDPTNRQTFVDAAGLAPVTGFFTKVTYDDADRLLTTTDATGATTSQTWSVKDRQLTSTDSTGRMSTTVYDHADRPVDSYGPAPASCFTGQVPTAACSSTVPREHTNYDEGINGYSVAWYDNTGLTGAPKTYATGFGRADGQMFADWGATTSPAPGIPAGTFSARLTGELQIPTTGNYILEAHVDNGVRMWIDDQLLLNSWELLGPRQVRATYNNTTANSIHQIRIEFYNGGGPGQLHVNWVTPTGTYQQIPGQYLRPRYGLTTSTVRSESGGLSDKVTATRHGENGLDPVFGLPTSVVSGALTSRTAYEAVGTGYLRTNKKIMPTGAETTYTHYGDTETRDDPCTPGDNQVNQGGMAKLTRLPAPASGVARHDEQVYDAAGRVVARATANTWTCMTYDARGRIASQKVPGNAATGERLVTTDYAVGGDPLTTAVSDYNGTVTTRVDLLGRVVAYTDANGLRTETTYDRAGRVMLERVVPPNPADGPQEIRSTYDETGRVLTQSLGSTLLATSSYDTAGELTSVAYANGSSLASVGRDAAGRIMALGWRTADGVTVAATVTHTRGGTVVDESLSGIDARPGAPNFVYDSSSRLIEAWVPGHHYTYDFTAAASSSCPAGTQVDAGLNTNRVRLVDQPDGGGPATETGYCYDAADRILATTGTSSITDIQYDNHGSITQYASAGSVTRFGWDAAERNILISTTGADPASVSYTRDATNRVIRRQVSKGDAVSDVRYGYTQANDNVDYAISGADKTLLNRSIRLNGGVLLTWKPNLAEWTWDHPTVRGDLALTTSPSGTQASDLRHYGPYGEPVAGSTANDSLPDNQQGDFDYGWLGQHQRPHEHAGALSIVQMGARPYSPALGRFLSVDSVDGGSANDYDYVAANPINATDLDGTFLLRLVGAVAQAGTRWVSRTAWPWVTRTAVPWIGRNILRPIWNGVKQAGRTFFLNPYRYVRANIGRAAFRCATWGAVGYQSMGWKGAVIGCYGNLVHDSWPTKKWKRKRR